jgi:tripeptidyl-peptidase-1
LIQVETFVKPTPDTLSKVSAWLTTHNLTSTTLSPAGEWIMIKVPISQANTLFAADYQTYTHTATGTQGFRTLSYSLPASLKGSIDAIHPATSFDFGTLKAPKFQVHQTKKRDVIEKRQSCSSEMTPACLQSLYGIPTARASQNSNRIGVSGFIEQWAQQADLNVSSSFLSYIYLDLDDSLLLLKTFLQIFRPDLSGSTFSTVSVDGGINPQASGDAGIEADLDIQYTVGIASGVPTTFFTVGENNPDGIAGFIDIVNSMESQSVIPHVWTTSYGFNEQDLDAQITS